MGPSPLKRKCDTGAIGDKCSATNTPSFSSKFVQLKLDSQAADRSISQKKANILSIIPVRGLSESFSSNI